MMAWLMDSFSRLEPELLVIGCQCGKGASSHTAWNLTDNSHNQILMESEKKSYFSFHNPGVNFWQKVPKPYEILSSEFATCLSFLCCLSQTYWLNQYRFIIL